MKTEDLLKAIVGLLVLVLLALVAVAVELWRLDHAIEPLASSDIARLIAAL